jgi:hypothetical protein
MNRTLENPYTPPEAKVSDPDQIMAPAKVYSPTQVKAGAFLGGPLTAVYLLKRNFDAMGKGDLAKRTLLLGLAFNLAFILVLPCLPSRFPNMVLPLAYSLLAGHLAETYQLKKQQILDSETFSFQSNWMVAGASLIGIVVFLAIAIAAAFLLASVGLMHLGS